MMNPLTVKFKKTFDHSVPIPEFKTQGAAAADVCSAQHAILPATGRVIVNTGYAVEVPPGYEMQVRPRSGLAAKHGVTVLNSPGTIDSDYRGELKIILHNVSSKPFEISPGDRIAQLVVTPVVRFLTAEVEQLTETERGEGGFGSTDQG